MRLFLFTLFIVDFYVSTYCQDTQFTSPQVTPFDDGRLHIKLEVFGASFDLDLRKNLFISDNYIEHTSNQQAKPQITLCHYKGRVANIERSWAAISYCDHRLNGLFEADGTEYHLQQTDPDDKVKVFTTSTVHNFSCGFTNTVQTRKRRYATKPDYAILNVTRYVELVVVNDHDVYLKYKNTDFIFEKTKQIVNIVNALYSSFNIVVVLVGAIIWTEKNEIAISNDSSQTLNHFLEYRRKVLMKLSPNDNAQLITAASFENGIVGKALKQTFCTYEYSGGVNSLYSESISLIATTIAHEMGHNFGMEHDTNDCLCPSKSCIMGASSSFPSPSHWSSCSVRQIEESFQHGIDHCLFNKPSVVFRPSCGNGLVDEGEQCDCGLADFCTNPCCNATTCQFKEGAECANGECCNRETCKIITHDANVVCRDKISSCDIPEKCDGISEYCPKDAVVKDGTECLEGYSYCFKGRCDTRQDQCQLLWGSKATVANYRCFQQNLNASSSGNCGYDKTTKTYLNCDNEKDSICGRLHCIHPNEKLRYGPEGAAIISKSRYHNGKIECYSVIIDLGLDDMDPGLVPNGAKCALDSMCVNQRCVPVNRYLMDRPCQYNCNKNGYCDNEGHCHCFEGFSSYDCGSHSGRYFLTVTFYVIFLLFLLSLCALFLYKNKLAVIDWFQRKKSKSKDYYNKKPKTNPINYDISLPLERKETCFPAAAETTVATVPSVQIKPIRRAPPIPNAVHPNNATILHKTPESSNKSTTARPKKPPPPIPLHMTPSSNQTSSKVKNLIQSFENP